MDIIIAAATCQLDVRPQLQENPSSDKHNTATKVNSPANSNHPVYSVLLISITMLGSVSTATQPTRHCNQISCPDNCPSYIWQDSFLEFLHLLHDFMQSVPYLLLDCIRG